MRKRGSRLRGGQRAESRSALASSKCSGSVRGGFGQIPVFTTKRGDRINHTKFRMRHGGPALAATGLDRRGVYATRHTFAAWSIRAGVNLFYLSRVMGTSLTQRSIAPTATSCLTRTSTCAVCSIPTMPHALSGDVAKRLSADQHPYRAATYAVAHIGAGDGNVGAREKGGVRQSF